MPSGKTTTCCGTCLKICATSKKKTLGHHIITGRKNYISIPEKYRPLVDRTNIVLTRNTHFNEDNCVIMHSLEQALQFAKEQGETEVFIIGGGQIYKEALENDLVDKLYITHVHNTYEADTFFPEINYSIWKRTNEAKELKDEKHAEDFTFAVYEKNELILTK